MMVAMKECGQGIFACQVGIRLNTEVFMERWENRYTHGPGRAADHSRADRIKNIVIILLAVALVGVGIMMSLAGSSRPASGSEHHLSHFFEITGIVKDKPYFAHGIDVAYSTVITAKIREELLKTDFPAVQYRPTEEALEAKLASIYGPVASGCMALQKKVGNYNKDRAAIYKENAAAIKEVLAEMPTAGEIEAILADIGLDMARFYEMYSQETLRDAILYAKDLKDRYTVLWLNYDLLGDPQGADI